MALRDRPATPTAPAPALQGTTAGVVSRCCAAAVDLGVVVVACVGAYLLVSGVVFLWRPASFSFPRVDRTTGVVLVGVAFVVYLSVAWALTGRTVGNTLMGLRVLRRDRGRLAPMRATLRALLYTAFPIGLLVCAVGRRRNSLQDLVLRTTVVYDWHEPGSSRHTPARSSAGR